MNIIELRDGYYIEIDEMNATLRQRYDGKTKEGEKKDAERTIGYYSTPREALKRFVALNRLDKMDGTSLSISEYVKELVKADAEVMNFLSELNLADFKPCRNMRCKNYEDDNCTAKVAGDSCPEEI